MYHRCYAFDRGQLFDAHLHAIAAVNTIAATLATNINQAPCPSSLGESPPNCSA